MRNSWASSRGGASSTASVRNSRPSFGATLKLRPVDTDGAPPPSCPMSTLTGNKLTMSFELPAAHGYTTAFCVLERERHDRQLSLYNLKRQLSLRGRSYALPPLERLRSVA